jgi:methionine-S-sulfoxide reductase
MKKFLITAIILLSMSSPNFADQNKDSQKLEKATFAGGCFWCMQPPFDDLKGVVSTAVGYTGGKTKNPTYEQVCEGTTGHAEAIEVVYDPAQISYSQLLEVFWQNINPTTLNRQFHDEGSQYRTAIFYHNDEQKRLAEQSKEELEKSGRFKQSIVTEIVPAGIFYKAEDYHQKYYKVCPIRYDMYHAASGRDEYKKENWDKNKTKH